MNSSVEFRRIQILGKPFIVLDSVRDRDGKMFFALTSEADFDRAVRDAEAGALPEPKILWMEQRGQTLHPVSEEQVVVLDRAMAERTQEALRLLAGEA